jgi:dUTP pyrophosphatase
MMDVDFNMQLKIKYLVPDLEKVKFVPGSDWLDLRASETVAMKQGEHKLIPLGICVELPRFHEAYIVPRSSTYKHFGVIQANHFGIVDENYKGNNDQWFFSCIAMRDTVINKNDRICQFRINKKQPFFDIIEVNDLENEDRKGFGSTGIH